MLQWHMLEGPRGVGCLVRRAYRAAATRGSFRPPAWPRWSASTVEGGDEVGSPWAQGERGWRRSSRRSRCSCSWSRSCSGGRWRWPPARRASFSIGAAHAVTRVIRGAPWPRCWRRSPWRRGSCCRRRRPPVGAGGGGGADPGRRGGDQVRPGSRHQVAEEHLTPGEPVGPAAWPVLPMNPKSGGKVERFGLVAEARRR